MIRIKTPATSANLSVGFDTLGIAFNIYNTFLFKEDKEFKLNSFSKEFLNDANLVLNSYMTFALEFLDETHIKKVEITLEENNIPASRGLGSSASCILAGVLAANQINKLKKTLKQCVDFSANLEGHSDNIFACAYGGLVASLKEEATFIHQIYEVSDKISFSVLIPSVEGSTKKLRDILPKKVDLNDAVHNLSRMAFLPEAFKNGDFELLKTIMSDKLHESYRYPYIPLSEEIKKLSERDDLIVSISGSGPSVLLISKQEHVELTKEIDRVYELVQVKVSQGVQIEVVK